jgi:small-conductance mechanosensitive channel
LVARSRALKRANAYSAEAVDSMKPTLRAVIGIVAFACLSAGLWLLGVFPVSHFSVSALHQNRALAQGISVLWWLALAWTLPVLADLAVWRTMFNRAEKPQARKLVSDLVSFVAYFAAACAIVAFVFDLPVNTIFATSGVVAIVIGLALQSTLSDVFSGIALNLEHPFRVGDWVAIGPENAGEVVETNWRSTHVRLGSRDILIVPNNVITKYRIINYSRPTPIHRVSVQITVAETEQPTDVRGILKSAALGADGVLDSPEPKVQIIGFNDNSLTYSVDFFVDTYSKSDDIKTTVMSEMWAHMAWSGVKRPQTRQEIEVHRRAPVDSSAHIPLAHLVGRIHVFKSLSDTEKSALAKSLQRHTVRKAEALVEQGTAGDSLFVVGKGVLEVMTSLPDGSRHSVARLGPGQYFGEMSLLTGSPRSASVVAMTDAVVYELNKEAFEPFVIARPEMVEELSRILAARSDVLGLLHVAFEAEPTGGALALLTQKIYAFFHKGAAVNGAVEHRGVPPAIR